ncbi:MAG: glycosyltransferase family 4 protein, partial [Candidatus Melainabacteria bacterium]|nr:glycosyltransferase family 4 protein [Candidatus Melainabacteria bacterium]
NLFRKKYDLDNKFLIMYSGNIGLTQGLEDIVKVADRLKENEDIQFLLVGEGASKKKLQDDVKRLVLSNVVFLPYQPKEELSHSLSAPNLHLITLQQGLAGLVVPSKVYGILSCGRPFIAWIEEKSEIFNIVSKYNCGIVVPPGNIEKMVEAILWAVSHPDKLEKMGVNSRNAALNNFDRRVSTAKFNKIISEVKN